MSAFRAAGLLLAFLILPLTSNAWTRTFASKFATLPAGTGNPEGLTVDSSGNVYVTTLNPTGTTGQLFVFNSHGNLKRQVGVAGSSPALLGLGFNPVTGALLIIDFGAAKVLKVNPVTGSSTVFTSIGDPGVAGANGLAFDAAGNVYISDSFQGVIWRTGKDGGAATSWASDPLLQPSAGNVPPFGANGLAFNTAQNILFVTNTSADRVVQIPVSGGVAGTASVFTNSVNGADGLFVDGQDNLWVAANQADEIVIINPTGKVIGKLGDFGGIDSNHSPIGLLFPASPALFGGNVYVTNFALDLRHFGAVQAVDSQWCAEVTSFTVARLPAVIPSVPQ